MKFYNKQIARKHGLGLALIVSFLQGTGGKMDVSQLREYMGIKYPQALSYLQKHQALGNIIGKGKETASGWFKKYDIAEHINLEGPMIERDR